MTTPVTVVICVRNRPRALSDCLRSLIRSRGIRFELIVVDDASDDSTPAVARQFAVEHADVPIRVVRSETNLGVSGARNLGLAEVTTPWVAFTDSDCVVDQDWLRNLAPTDAPWDLAGVSGLVFEPCRSNLAERAFAGTATIGSSRLQGRKLIGCNMLLRTEVARAFLFDPLLTYYCDEDDLAARLSRAQWKFQFSPAAVVEHRHTVDLPAFLRLAWRQGRGSARFWAKQRRFIGRDVVLTFIAVASLPLGWIRPELLALPMSLLATQVSALWFAERVLKKKSALESLAVLPVCVLHNLVKSASVMSHLPKQVFHPPSPHAPRPDPGPCPSLQAGE